VGRNPLVGTAGGATEQHGGAFRCARNDAGVYSMVCVLVSTALDVLLRRLLIVYTIFLALPLEYHMGLELNFASNMLHAGW
jgi:hypothetical protein